MNTKRVGKVFKPKDTKKKQRDSKTNGREWVREAKGEEGQEGDRSACQMLGPLGLSKVRDRGNTLIYLTQVVDTVHCLGLLCFMITTLMPLKNKNNLFIHLEAK